LQRQLGGTALPVLAEGANGDEGKEQGRAEIEGAQGGHQDAVQRCHAASHLRELQGGATRLAEQTHRLDIAVAGQRREDQQQRPEGAAGQQPTQLEAK